MDLKFDLSDFKESTVRRMLREFISTENERSLPLHKRGKQKPEIEDDATEEADEENEKLVELAAEQGEPKDIPVTHEDISEEAGEKLESPKKAAPKKVAGKLGKPYTPS